ncbi:MAG: hypothetical protein M0P70_04795 [Desulfobulbaceae bacterium]|nr:hypothetical protein [Desulfobulbaceae bacterium]
MSIKDKCPICQSDMTLTSDRNGRDVYHIDCKHRCGEYSITRNALINLQNTSISTRQSANISGWLCDNQGYEIDCKIIDSLTQLPSPSFHEKSDKILLYLEKRTPFAGARVNKTHKFISVGWCVNYEELKEITNYLKDTQRIIEESATPNTFFKIIPQGWDHLEKIKFRNFSSRQCFVAMWFAPEMEKVYSSAIKPAIEFVEEGLTRPRFEALKINNFEHINDINDEIIGQIRRSRFMVCDLTGHRGGVYFEAGFAYGLGIDVIYTCRKDWTHDEILKDKTGNSVKKLFDSNSNIIKIKKEGVHFDLAHRNRIEWTYDELPEFKERLEKRIKSVIKIN